MKKLYSMLVIGLIAFTSCQKTDFDLDAKGEALNGFSLSAPNNNALLVLNSATPTAPISISWNAAAPGVNTAPTYKWVAALKGGSLDAPYLEIVSDNGGKNSTLTLTQKALDDALKAKGVADGAKVDLIWTVVADNGTVKVKAGQTYNLSVTRMGDGVSNFKLFGPLSGSNVLEINPGSTTDNLVFKWEAATPGKAGAAVTYKVKFVKEGESFSTPLFSLTSDNNGTANSLTISYKNFDAALTAAGLADQATPAKLQWTVEATSGAFVKPADYVNQFYVVRETKMFMVGSATPNDWTVEQATQMIADPRNPGAFYAYVRLKAGELKFVNQQQWPGGSLNSTDWGGSNGTAVDGPGETNIPVPTAGVYRVTFDQKNLKYYIQAPNPGAVGLVGAFQGWDPSSAIKMAYTGVNKFVGLATMAANDEFKLHDGSEWDNSTPAKPRYYGTGAVAGKLYDDGGSGNLKNTEGAGLVRVVFDGSDIKNLKYSLTPGTVYLIGNATVGGWDNNTGMSAAQRPPMTYLGNGKWTVTTNLTAGEVKFIVKQGSWDYNYGKDGATGIKEGGDNIVIAANGNYTITLDEYNRTYSVVKN